VKTPPVQPNEEIEEAIKDSNNAIRNLLFENWHLIPIDLLDDAGALTPHYDAWYNEYLRVCPKGNRLPKPFYVYVGPKGIKFPKEFTILGTLYIHMWAKGLIVRFN
jgi:hypothetical protein